MKVKKLFFLCSIMLCGLMSCQQGNACHCGENADGKVVADSVAVTNQSVEPAALSQKAHSYIERKDTLGLTVLYPEYRRVDLVCDTMPEKSDTSVILVAEAAYTGQRLESFNHMNVAGDHVSGGKRYKGYSCSRNTGAFVWYNAQWKFLYKSYTHELDSAAAYGGAGFGQELIIHEGENKETVRPNSSKNQFRALCENRGRLCVIESDSVLTFGDFRKKMLQYGVREAIYLDMGGGWNHAWYRDADSIKEMHPKTHNYCTNWITFYK